MDKFRFKPVDSLLVPRIYDQQEEFVAATKVIRLNNSSRGSSKLSLETISPESRQRSIPSLKINLLCTVQGVRPRSIFGRLNLRLILLPVTAHHGRL